MDEQERSIPILRSILFVPAIVERFVARAPDTGTDVICLAIERPGLDGIVLSKTDSAETVRRVGHYLTILERRQEMERGAVAIIPLVESAEAILSAREIAGGFYRLVALSLGAEDLAAG